VVKMRSELKGVFPVLQTPFDDRGEVDEESLRREVEFCVEAGAHGIVTPALASEFYVLTEGERNRIADVVLDEAEGRRPVVIGVSGVSTWQAVMFGTHAEDAGAEAVIALPPYTVKLGEEEIYGYYKALSDAVGIPIFVQNTGPPFGTPLSPGFVARLVRGIEDVKYVKEENMPEGHFISALLQHCGSELKGVFGGAHGRWILDELRRGACGNMPAAEFTDVHVQVYERFAKGDERGAREVFNKLLPLINISGAYGLSFHKEVLRRRGVFKHLYTRVPSPTLDRYDQVELEALLKEVEPLYKVR